MDCYTNKYIFHSCNMNLFWRYHSRNSTGNVIICSVEYSFEQNSNIVRQHEMESLLGKENKNVWLHINKYTGVSAVQLDWERQSCFIVREYILGIFSFTILSPKPNTILGDPMF